ncbi:MAG: DUF839 domain-containing protein, partial [Candidatus Saccharibacteria bacterium]|nr:DUF839 domain-containing protein [Pseudorhodobacter sp.]
MKNQSTPMRDVIADRSRRGFLQTAGAALGAIATQGFVGSLFSSAAYGATAQSSLKFTELTRIYDKMHHVADGYKADVVVAWGDAMKAGQGPFDPAMDATTQAERFGYNCDYVAYMPLPRGSQTSDHGLLCVNNEYVSPNVMFADMTEDDAATKMTAEQVALCNMAIGHSIVEIIRKDGVWSTVQDSPMNRRITLETPMLISGPAAGNDHLKTTYDATGTLARGTTYNCSGGVTPWGTVLTCEEGASDTFGGSTEGNPDAAALERYGYDGADFYGRARFDARFDMSKEPNEPNRFDWVVEIDPYDPTSTPIKRTALG